jgi:hypothetical protein
MAREGCLRQNKLIHGGASLFTAQQGYLRRENVIQDKTTCLRRDNLVSRQSNAVYGGSRLSAAAQGHPGEGRLFAAQQGCLWQSKVVAP